MILSLTILLAMNAPVPGAAQPPVSYRKQVAPIFASSCNACHSGSAPQSGLALTSYVAILKGGRRGKAIVPGNPATSLLIQYDDGTKHPSAAPSSRMRSRSSNGG